MTERFKSWMWIAKAVLGLVETGSWRFTITITDHLKARSSFISVINTADFFTIVNKYHNESKKILP